MAKDKRIKLIIAIIAMFISFYQIKSTYSKYIESKQGNADFTIASWKILLNDTDISSNTEMSSIVNPIYDSNSNVESGFIAPGSTGHFDLEIDATDTKVTFSYNISISPSTESGVEDLVITGYKIGNGQIIPVQNSINSLTNTVAHDAQNKVVTLHIYFKWIEGESESEQMNNAADTAAATGNRVGKINVRATFTQVANS